MVFKRKTDKKNVTLLFTLVSNSKDFPVALSVEMTDEMLQEVKKGAVSVKDFKVVGE